MFVRTIYGLKNGAFNYSEFICDTEDDLENLPTNITKGNANGKEIPTCAVGSEANIIVGGKVYILSNENVWTYWTTRNSSDSSEVLEKIKELELNKADKTVIVTKTASDTNVSLDANTFYNFPTMVTLTVTAPTTGMTGFRFTSGATPTTLVINGAIIGEYEIEANKTYEVNISDTYGLIAGWTVE